MRWLLGGLLLAWSIVFAAWLVLQWGILPRIEQWRPEIEARASGALGLPVRIGTIRAADRGGLGWSRAIELRDVVLLDPASPDGAREALRLPRVHAALSPASLLPGWDGRWRLRFEQLLVEGAALEMRRDAQGRLHVAGVALGAGGTDSDDGQLADWFFSQHEIAIRNASLSWSDELRGAPPLVLSAIDLVVRNGVRRHDLRLDFTPPADWGARLSLRGRFVQPLLGDREGPGRPASVLSQPGDWRRWRGQVYAELPAIDVAPLQRHVDLPLALDSGQGALRAWLEIEDAQAVGVTADLALRDVALRLPGDTDVLGFARIDGRVGGSRNAEGGSLSLRQFGFITADGGAWPAADASANWRLTKDGALAGGELRAQRIDLGLLAQTLARLPADWFADGLHDTLASLAPRGIASQIDARWEGPLAAPQRYRLQASLRGLALAARPHETASEPGAGAASAAARAEPGRPGLENVDLDLNATEAGGTARVALRAGALEFPGVFEQPRIALDQLDGDLSWRVVQHRSGVPPQFDLRARKLRFANADAAGEFDASWATAPPGASGASRFPGLLDLNGRLTRADATRVARYLPLGIEISVRDYVDRAVQAGRASAVAFVVRGDLRRFPFGARPAAAGRAAVPADGEFRVAAQLEGVRFAYLPGDPAARAGEAVSDLARPWPAFTDVKGELVFERQAMELRNLSARLGGIGSGGFELRNVRGAIRDLGHEPVLNIEGGGRGPLADALRYVDATPIGGWLDGALAPATATGAGELQLALTIPLHGEAPTRVRGNVLLPGNDLRLRPDTPLLAGAKARIAFTESSFALTEGSARALGGEVRIDGAKQADGSLRFNAQGSASADGLRRAGELGALARAAQRFSGQAAYRLALGFDRGLTEWQLTSDLAGLGIDLPAPLRKAPAEPLPLRAAVARAADAPVAEGARARDLLRVELGAEGARVLQAQWLREHVNEGVRVLRGGIAVNEALPQPAQGVAASLNLARLDLDAWQQVADAASGAPGPVATSAGAPADAGYSAYAPTQLSLRAQELLSGGRRLTRVVAGLTRGSGADEGVWRVNGDTAELNGYGEYRPPAARGGAGGRIYARLARLSLPKSEADAVSTLLEQAPPNSVPALDIVVDDLELHGKRLGRMEVEALNREGGESGREWRLNRFRLTTPDAQFNATGQWALPAPGAPKRRAVLDFRLDVLDGGALLARLGQPEVVRGAKGRLSGQLSWLGSPLTIDYPSLGGQINMAIESGQFLKADPGIAKLLGVLSLQALPRRLLLDFRDVFAEGFVFDSLGGDATIARGVASTRNLRMRGLQAIVLMEGSADIERETQDLHVWVVPEINAGAAALAVAAINPAIGLGSFLAQWFLRRPIIEAGTREFRVSGAWADPKVERVERKLGDAVPPLDAASAAPGPSRSQEESR